MSTGCVGTAVLSSDFPSLQGPGPHQHQALLGGQGLSPPGWEFFPIFTDIEEEKRRSP